MLDTHLFLAFVLAVTILMLIPGPNVALIVANSVTYGYRYGLLTVAGTSSAMVVQLGLTVLGMTELLGTLGAWFEWIRWIGVAYLIYLGVMQWRAPPVDLTKVPPEPNSPRAMFTRTAVRFILSRRSVEISPRVSGVRGTHNTTKSLSASSASRSRYDASSSASSDGGIRRRLW